MLFEIKTKIRRCLNRLFKFNHPISYPFLTMDGFRSFADFVYDQFYDFNPSDVQSGDIIFVRGNFLNDFFNKIHPKIKNKYVLLSGNEDFNVTAELSKYIDDKIIHWFAQNLLFKHDKVSVLPIGIENKDTFKNTGSWDSFLLNCCINSISKKNIILFGFCVSNEERNVAEQVLLSSDISEKIAVNRTDYYSALKEYKFIASPGGAGIDCHRTWEAFYFKVIPIMLKNDFNIQLEKIGLPVMIINDWNEINNLTELDLENFYNTNIDKFDDGLLNIFNWFRKINLQINVKK